MKAAHERKKKLWLLTGICLLLVLFGLYILLSGIGGGLVLLFGIEPGSNRIFREYLADPIPQDVRILSGEGMFWQGGYAKLVFEASEESFRAVSSDFQEVKDCYDHGYEKDLREEYDHRFDADLVLLPDDSCFFKELHQTGIRPYELVLFWDRKRKVAYFSLSELNIAARNLHPIRSRHDDI